MVTPLRIALGFMMLASVPVAGRAACPADTDAFSASVDAASAAFAAMDVEGFSSRQARADADLACLEEPLTRSDVAAYHRMSGMSAFLQRDREGAVAAFRAALAVQPAFELPASIAPEGHPLRALYEQAAVATDADPVAVLVPRGATLLVDGQRSTTRPVDRPALLQLLGPDGAVLWSGRVDAGAVLPAWPEVPEVEGVAEALPVAPMPAPRKVSIPLLSGAGVAVVAAGGLYAGAWASRAAYDDPDTPFEDLDGLRTRTNTLTTASQVTAVTAVGLGVAAFTLGPR